MSGFGSIPVHADPNGWSDSDTRQVEPHFADFGFGPMLTIPAVSFQIGQTEVDGVCIPAIFAISHKGAMCRLMSADEAEDMGNGLLAIAAEVKAAAEIAATAAIAKAGGK